MNRLSIRHVVAAGAAAVLAGALATPAAAQGQVMAERGTVVERGNDARGPGRDRPSNDNRRIDRDRDRDGVPDRFDRYDNRRAPDRDRDGIPDRYDRRDNRYDARPVAPRYDRDGRWYDNAHGHNRYYMPPGRVVVLPPRPPAPLRWGGVTYRFWDGYWATPGPRGWITVRPPVGIYVRDLPSFRTALVIGGLSYFYLNGIYYRERADGYEVVAPPVLQADVPPPLPYGVTSGMPPSYVYPRYGQSAEQQAADEYECHRWATSQSGFDPTGAAVGQGTTWSTNGRSEYERARLACLDGRGYTVR